MKPSGSSIALLLAAALFGSAGVAGANNTGKWDSARPGSEGCSCHSVANVASPSTQPFILGLPIQGYVPGRPYDLTVVVLGVALPNTAFAGFNLEATAGDLASPDNSAFVRNTTRCDYFRQAGCEDSIFGCPPQCDDPQHEWNTVLVHQATHNLGVSKGFQWSLQWTAPPAGTGDVTFYLSGNVVNGNGQPDPVLPGDQWWTVLNPELNPLFTIPEGELLSLPLP